MNHIYLDNNSTTQIDPKVLESMDPYLRDNYGNPSSNNYYGQVAKNAIKSSRLFIAKLINANPKDIYFTSGATESNNLAIKGIADKFKSQGKHIVTFKTEHKAVLDSCKHLEQNGFKVTYLDVNNDGSIDLDLLDESLRSDTILCAAMHANNEIGIIHPIDKISELCREKNVNLFVDAAQSVGKINVDVNNLDADYLSFSSHKIYGPKGIGCLYIRDGKKYQKLESQIHGGGQESNYRSGTLNVPGVVGFGKAAEIILESLEKESKDILFLRNKIYNSFLNNIKDSKINGSMNNRIPGNLNISFLGVDSIWLMTRLYDKVSISNGSACNSHTIEPSHVLRAINTDDQVSNFAIRICIGRFNTETEIDYFINLILDLVSEYREKTKFYHKKVGSK